MYTSICIQVTKAAVSGSLVVRQQPELPGAGKLWPDIKNNQRFKPLQVSKEYPHKITSLTAGQGKDISPIFLSVIKLLGYVSRAVRPSVSWGRTSHPEKSCLFGAKIYQKKVPNPQ